MKKNFMLFFLVLPIFTSCFAKTVSAEFEDSENLPDGIIVCDDYYEKTQNIFLVLEDYVRSYSKIVEYDTKKLEITKTIFSCEEKFSINDFNASKNGFVFSVVKMRYPNDEANVYSDIYHYDCLSNQLTKVNEAPVSESARGLYPCNPHINESCIVYLCHDFEKETSQIVMYDLGSKKSEVIVAEKFPESTTGITFLDLDGNKMLYNSFNQENPELNIFDLSNKAKIQTVKALKTTSVHYNGCLDSESNVIVLYANSSRYGDLIYMIDLGTEKSKRLVGFRDNTLLKNDQMYFDGRNIMYTVQRDISGYIYDHYYAEIYDVQRLQSAQKLHTAYCFLTKGWKGFLVYDKKLQTKKIHLQIEKKGASK